MIDKNILDTKKNKSICQFPFVHTHSTPRYERWLCCIQKGPAMAKGATIEEYWNSDKMKQVRLDMLAGKKIPECQNCYLNEDDGVTSMRRTELLNDKLVTEETLATGHVDFLPVEYDYRTIHCNLTCVHCGPHYSSAHIPLAIKLGQEEKTVSHTFNHEYEKKCTAEVIAALDRRELTYIYWAGGEPMMSPQHWEIMQHMKDIYEVDPDYVDRITVMYNSNLTVSTWKKTNAYEFLAFCKPNFSPSLDGVGKTFEYIRDGGIWSEVEENWKSAYKNFYSEKSRRSTLTVALVVTSHWLFDCDRYLNFFEPYNVEIMSQRLQRWIPKEKVEFGHPFTGNLVVGFVDPNFYPKSIMIPAFENAIERVKRSTVGGKEHLLNVIQAMRTEYDTYCDYYTDHFISLAKGHTLHAETIKKNTLSDLLREINTEAWMWYNSIEAINDRT